MFDPSGHGTALVTSLVTEHLGSERASKILNKVQVKVFTSYLLRDPDCIPSKSIYEPRIYGNYSGVKYFRPDGWIQAWITPPAQASQLNDVMCDWPIAYHGTASKKLGSILEAGLRKPGEMPGIQQAHGCVGAGPGGAIYVTPSLWLASHPVYSEFLEVGPNRWMQIAFKLRVRPDSYTVQESTLSQNRHWGNDVQIDPNFAHHCSLEWLVSNSKDVVVVGLMIRELGKGVDQSMFGGLAAKVQSTAHMSANHCWTALLKEALSSSGYLIYHGSLCTGFDSADWQLCSMEELQSGMLGTIDSPEFSLPSVGIQRAHLRFNDYKSIGPCVAIAITETMLAFIQFELAIGEYCEQILAQVEDGELHCWLDKHLKDAVFFDLASSVNVRFRVCRTDISPTSLRLEVEENKALWSIDKQLSLFCFPPGAYIRSPTFALEDSYGNKENLRFLFDPQAWRDGKGVAWCSVRSDRASKQALVITLGSKSWTGILESSKNGLLQLPLAKALAGGRVIVTVRFSATATKRGIVKDKPKPEVNICKRPAGRQKTARP